MHHKLLSLWSSSCQVGVCVCVYEQNQSRSVGGVAHTRFSCRRTDGRRSANLNAHPQFCRGHNNGSVYLLGKLWMVYSIRMKLSLITMAESHCLTCSKHSLCHHSNMIKAKSGRHVYILATLRPILFVNILP